MSTLTSLTRTLRLSRLFSGAIVGWSALFSLSGCEPRSAPAPREKLSIFAASSLTEAFQKLEQSFESAHPDVDVRLTFSGSQVLRVQLEQGARADVFASANQQHMDALILERAIAAQQPLAENDLVIIVPLRGSEYIQTFTDLTKAKRIVLGTENVPIGIYARQVVRRAGNELGPEFAQSIERHTVSIESNVRLVRAKIELGEADAAIVYRTDAASSKKLRVVQIPPKWNVRATYPIGLVANAPNEKAARVFLKFTRTEQTARILKEAGFSPLGS